MRRSTSALLAVSSLLLAVVSLPAATRPRYGGVLRVEMRAAVDSLDPTWLASNAGKPQPGTAAPHDAGERLAMLVFDRLVRLDVNGLPAPLLASSWQQDPERRRWQFWMQRNARFHDGTPITPAHVAAALNAANPGWEARVVGDSVVVEFASPRPHLLAELARARNSIVLRGADGAALGSGPFLVREFTPGRRLVLAANEQYWGGRPYLDGIEVQMNRTAREQAIAFDLGRADVIELPLEELGRMREGTRQAAVSAPADLLVLVFDPGRPIAQENAAALREAIAASLDRGSIHQVLLQGQGAPAAGLLPEWVSGYSFLFSVQQDLARARRLGGGQRTRLTLLHDVADPVARAVAERVAVNAREAGISLQVVAENFSQRAGNADVRLLRLRLPCAQPAAALHMLAEALGQSLPPHGASPEQLYFAERSLLETYRVIPVAHLPEAYGLAPAVRNWWQPRAGGWPLEDVWLSRPQSQNMEAGRP